MLGGGKGGGRRRDLSKGSSYVAWRQTPTQTGVTGLGRGSWRVGPAHAPSALPGRFPTPNLRSPQNYARRGSPLQLPAGPRPVGEGSRVPARAAKVPPPPGWGDQSERRGTATLPDLLPPSTIREAAPPGPPRCPASPFPLPAHVKQLLPPPPARLPPHLIGPVSSREAELPY